jgi:hypothetical protein
VFGLIAGFTTDVGDVVLVVGVVVVLLVTAGFVVAVGLVVAGLDVDDVIDVFGANVVFGAEEVPVVMLGFAVSGLVNDEVNGRDFEPPADVIEVGPRPVKAGALFRPRMTLSSGARSSSLASGSCLLDVRFFKIAMFYPVFFTNEVRPAILLTGLNFAVLANVLGGAVGVAFCTGISFATSMR